MQTWIYSKSDSSFIQNMIKVQFRGPQSSAKRVDTDNIKAYLPTITMRPRQNGRHFADDIFKCIFLNENFRISHKISLKFVSEGPIDNIPALVQIMAWRWPGNKPLSDSIMIIYIYASLGLNEIGTLTIKTYRQTAVNQSVVGRVNQQDFFFLVNVLYLYTTWAL